MTDKIPSQSAEIKKWRLIYSFSKREIISNYHGTALGAFWMVATPLFLLGIYTLVFSQFFKMQWSASQSSVYFYSLAMYLGLLCHSFFSDIINRSPTLILSNTNYVKKVVFPLEILSMVLTISSFFQLLLGMVVWLIFYSFFVGEFRLSMLLFPVVLFPMFAIGLGLSLLLSALGVFLKDIGKVSPLIAILLMFLAPVFYPMTNVNEKFAGILMVNPLTPLIQNLRIILLDKSEPDFNVLLISYITAFALLVLGRKVFASTRRGFADVL